MEQLLFLAVIIFSFIVAVVAADNLGYQAYLKLRVIPNKNKNIIKICYCVITGIICISSIAVVLVRGATTPYDNFSDLVNTCFGEDVIFKLLLIIALVMLPLGMCMHFQHRFECAQKEKEQVQADKNK